MNVGSLIEKACGAVSASRTNRGLEEMILLRGPSVREDEILDQEGK